MMHDPAYVPYTKIADKLPICKGDILYVVSDILDLAKRCRDNSEKFECERFIQSLQEAVGESGTILFPTVSFDFCKGLTFDYHKTKGRGGALVNAALKMPDFKRTKHPIYSFMVWGKAQADLVAMDNHAGFDMNSPFGYMHRHKAKALSVGLAPTLTTFVHYVEQEVGVDYRFHKDFYAPYVDENGNVENRTYSAYVSDLEINPQSIPAIALHDVMSTLGIRKNYSVNSIPFNITCLFGMFEIVSLEIKYNNANNLYRFEGTRNDQVIIKKNKGELYG